MKFTRALAALVLAGGSVVWADAPTTKPAPVPADYVQQQSQNRVHSNPGAIRRMILRMFSAGRNATAGVRPATPQEWDEMMDFLHTNSPARFSVLSSLNLPPTSEVRLDAIRKWRNYTFTRDHFPAVADQMVQRFHLEDDLFSLTLSAQENRSDIDEYRDKIHDKIAQMVQLDFTERQTRIDKLEALLKDEKAKLAADQESEDKTVDQRTDAIMNRLEKLNRTLASSATTRPNTQDDASDEQIRPWRMMRRLTSRLTRIRPRNNAHSSSL